MLRRLASSPSSPPQYWLTLVCLLRHFSRVCLSGSRNQLSVRALADTFSPLLFRTQTVRLEYGPFHHLSSGFTVLKSLSWPGKISTGVWITFTLYSFSRCFYPK